MLLWIPAHFQAGSYRAGNYTTMYSERFLINCEYSMQCQVLISGNTIQQLHEWSLYEFHNYIIGVHLFKPTSLGSHEDKPAGPSGGLRGPGHWMRACKTQSQHLGGKRLWEWPSLKLQKHLSCAIKCYLHRCEKSTLRSQGKISIRKSMYHYFPTPALTLTTRKEERRQRRPSPRKALKNPVAFSTLRAISENSWAKDLKWFFPHGWIRRNSQTCLFIRSLSPQLPQLPQLVPSSPFNSPNSDSTKFKQ